MQDDVPSVEVLVGAGFHLDNPIGVGEVVRINEKENVTHASASRDKISLKYGGNRVMSKERLVTEGLKVERALELNRSNREDVVGKIPLIETWEVFAYGPTVSTRGKNEEDGFLSSQSVIRPVMFDAESNANDSCVQLR